MNGLGMVRWAGLAAVLSGMFMTFSGLLNLTIYIPDRGEAAHTGYQAVGSGVILLALTLLFVGMLGLFAGSARTNGPTVIEHGDAKTRYILAGFESLRPEPAGHRVHAPIRGTSRGARTRGPTGRDAASRRRRRRPSSPRGSSAGGLRPV